MTQGGRRAPSESCGSLEKYRIVRIFRYGIGNKIRAAILIYNRARILYNQSMTKTLPITKARNELPELVRRVATRLDEYVITVKGVPQAVLMSAAEYESWKETDEILADKEFMKGIREGEEDIKKGRVFDWEDVKRELKLDV